MASENGRTNPALDELFLAEPYRFEFFQAVRLLERLYPEREPVGHYAEPRQEVVRFRAQPTLTFPPSEVHTLKPAKEDAPSEMTVAMMGLTGPSGVLPQVYTEQVMECIRQWRADRTERQRQEDDREHPLVEFLDIFNHRLISLFFRAWEKYHFPLGYERGRDDDFTACLFALIGMGTRGLRGQLSFADDGLLVYGGLLAQRPRSASALGAILGDYFGVPAHVRQFIPQQLKLDQGSVSKLGKANNRLGIDSVAGSLVWDCQSKFRLTFGPLSWSEFLAFLPDKDFRLALAVGNLLVLRTLTIHLPEEEQAQAEDGLMRLLVLIIRGLDLERIAARCLIGTAFRPVVELAQMIAGREFDFDIQPVLKAADVPPTVLTCDRQRQSSLGLTTWLSWPTFKITAQTLQKLRAAGVPEVVIEKLRLLCSTADDSSPTARKDVPAIFCRTSAEGRAVFEPGQCHVVKGGQQFIKLLRSLLGEEHTARFKSLIMEYAEAPPVPRDADQVVLEGIGH